jgi:two-component system sensor histidine kinase MtrB
MHGGSVTAANAPDGGAVFTLMLPNAEAADETDPGSELATATPNDEPAAEPPRPAASRVGS